jgi:tRNA(adenine34) deaminase
MPDPEAHDADQSAMREALAQARLAAAAGEVPVGAVVVVDGKIVAAAHNRREADADPTAHAEILALRQAGAAVGSWRLADATLVVTLEPCPMCAGAAVAARIARIVYGAPDPRAGAVGSLYNLASDPRLNHEMDWQHGVLAEDCAALLTSFFTERR